MLAGGSERVGCVQNVRTYCDGEGRDDHEETDPIIKSKIRANPTPMPIWNRWLDQKEVSVCDDGVDVAVGALVVEELTMAFSQSQESTRHEYQ